MKLLKSFFSSIFALVIVLSTNVACKGYDAEEPAKALTIHIARQNYANREVRAAYTNVEEDNIQTLTVLFVDANGNLVKYGANRELTYKFDTNGAFGLSPTWKDNNADSHTLVLNEVKDYVLKDVQLYVLANVKQDLYTKLQDGTITTMAALEAEVHQTLETDKANEMPKPFLMTGVSNEFSWTGDTDKEVEVSLKRAIAKVTLVLHYDWDKLKYDSNLSTTEDRFSMMDFGAETKVGVSATSASTVNSAELKFEGYDAAKKTATYTFYVNEYDLTKAEAAQALPPYLLLKLKSIDDPNYSLKSGVAPAANATALDTYYRLLFPMTIERNNFYTLHAHISEAGSDGKEGARTLHFNLKVEPWHVDNMNFAPGYLRADFAEWLEGDNL